MCLCSFCYVKSVTESRSSRDRRFGGWHRGGRLVELALVDEVHIVASAHATEDGDVGHRHLCVA